MKQAPFLQKGDKISIVAPSFGVTTEPYMSREEAAIKNFKRLGYVIEEGANVHLNEGIVSSSTPQNRAKEFLDAYKSDASVIISCGGGELMDEILPCVDFDEIRSLPPKWFMGFSDNTHLTYTLTTILDLITIYGPNFPSFYERPIRLNQKDALRMLSGEKDFEGYAKWNKPNFKKRIDLSIKKETNPLRRNRYITQKIITSHNWNGDVEGRLLGGCLDCLITICGTRFDKTKEFIQKHDEGIIWYLEACDLNPLSIRRAIFQLKEAGWFSSAKAFLIGRPLCWDQEMFSLNRFDAVLGVLKEFNVPVLFDVDLGHYAPSLPMKNGALAKVSYDNKNIYLHYYE